MDITINFLTPILTRVFHAPEIWLILRTLGIVAPNLEVPPEIAYDQTALLAAQENLLKQGMLLRGGQGEMKVAPEIEALVRPSVYPDIVFVANIADNAKYGKFARIICFGWTLETLVVNWVDEVNDHHFESYPSEDIKAVILAYLFNLCNLDVDEPDTIAVNLGAREIERAIAQMKQTVLLMAINDVQAPEQATQAISWFVSGRHAWLIQKGASIEAQVPKMASRADIALAIFELVEQALPKY